MPGKVKVKIVAGRNLPVMDRSSDTTDAYVEIKLGNTTYKTDVCRKSLNPQWNSEWYRFEVDDSELQDEPLQLRLMDHDTYSANDAIGKVYLDLNPLLLPVPPKPVKNVRSEGSATTTANSGSVMSGWIPVYDTMHGIRGEVHVIVKVELFSDFNRFRQSSCGVLFFCSPAIPQGYYAQVIHGFVEELVVNDDPEYQWIDKIRTPRASNEARQTLFFKLSGEVQRKIGLKALDLGGNAVIGYRQCFDLEGESGIVARGIGTAVSIVRLHEPAALNTSTQEESTTSLVCRHEAAAASHFVTDGEREGATTVAHDEDRAASSTQLTSSAHKQSQSPTKLTAAPAIHRRSSDSDLSVTPKGCYRKRNSLTGSGSSCPGQQGRPPALHLQPPVMNQDNFEMLEYPFITVSKFPPGFVQSIGGTVSSRSVKLLERITNLEEPETRDTWWKELRMEVRSHARALGCNVVLGYAEHTSICDDVCVLSAAGTAAVISLQYSASELDTSGGGANTAVNITSGGGANTTVNITSTEKQAPQQQPMAQPLVQTTQLDQSQSEQASTEVQQLQYPHPQPPSQAVQGLQPQKQANSAKQSHDRVAMTSSLDRTDFEKGSGGKSEPAYPGKVRHLSEGADGEILPGCFMCHIPYSESSVPFRVKMMKCAMCRKGKVPDVLLTTMEPPEGIPVTGRGCLVQAYVCRPKRDTKGELNAKEISDGLPFLEYELHRMLLNKLKVKGMNAIFGLKVQVSIGERMLVGLATGTAMFLTPLPSPPVPTITAGNSWSDERRLLEVQKTLSETVKRNREIYHLKSLPEGETANGRNNQSDTEDSEDDLPDLDLATGNKDTCVMEVDDNEDVDVISLLMDPHPPDGFFVVNTEVVPGLEDMEVVRNLQMFTQVWRAKVTPTMPPVVYSKHFHRMLQSVYFKLRRMVPCALGQLQFFVELPEPDELQLTLLGMALGLGEAEKNSKIKRKTVPPSVSKEPLKKDENDLIFSLEEDVVLEDITGATAVAAAASAAASSVGSKMRPKSPHQSYTLSQRLQNPPKIQHKPPRERYGVDITPLSYIPGGKIDRYLGNLNFFFIRESTAIRESGGLSGFIHSFIADVLAIVRAHVTALGGNAMVAYFISENVLLHNPHKNQGQCLINVGGDVVHASYYSTDQ
ncbi:C2 domain-containing protein 5 isoform X1 [Thrips palmi]|uniref:C2 domain-containing protein 5 isoform X1 n=1 Tax=Thrips palmi TaxID=161013 RepID=A0A6P9A7T8_THRPL|nr:C2 domain-containing protein 5 isoform X1 [Thrips palmi]